MNIQFKIESPAYYINQRPRSLRRLEEEELAEGHQLEQKLLPFQATRIFNIADVIESSLPAGRRVEVDEREIQTRMDQGASMKKRCCQSPPNEPQRKKRKK